ncbi:MAG TPA: hypothetical protein VGN11_04435, partial [Candidatus Baltobacteraceae bacterium]|nr:hypothetical protein [Candidatus Baltobacteraceae bacterium]
LCLAPAAAQTTAPPSPDQIYYKALDRLRALPDPPYIDYTFHVTAKMLRETGDDTYHVVFRSADGIQYQHPMSIHNHVTADGDTHADSIDQNDMAPDFFLRMQRNAGTKNATPGTQQSIFGFSPEMFATPEPEEVDGKKTITTVRATYNSRYAITLVGIERVATCEAPAYHLKLSPRHDQDKNILRDLWVDPKTYDICKMSVGAIMNAGVFHAPVSGTVDFRSIGPYRLATDVTGNGRARFLFASTSAVMEMTFDNITFPESEPAWMFDKTLLAQHRQQASGGDNH